MTPQLIRMLVCIAAVGITLYLIIFQQNQLTRTTPTHPCPLTKN